MQRKIPTLRFPEFNDQFKSTSLNSIINSLESGVSVNSISRPAEAGKYGVLKTSCLSNGKFRPLENKEIIDEDIHRAKLNPEKNTMLVSRMNTPQLVGEIGFVDKDYKSLFLPDRLWMAKIKPQIQPKWLTLLLTTERHGFEIRALGTGTSGTMKNISKKSFLSLGILVPTIEEQNKTAAFFLLLDQKIEKQEEKIEKLEELKKGMMQKIFSRELRFKDENREVFPDWLNKKLVDVAEIQMGQSPSGKNYSSDENQTVLIQGNADIEKGLVIPRIYTSEITKTCESGDIILTVRAPVGEIALSNITACIGRGVCAIRGDKYIYFYLSYFNVIGGWKRLSQGSTFESVNGDDIKGLRIPYPSIIEREKISSYLSSINSKITKEEKRLELLNEQKKGFMQLMFV